MITNLYSVYDVKTKLYQYPFQTVNDETAKRSFKHVCNEKNHIFNNNPEDYSLFKVGSWDDEECFVEIDEAPIRITTAMAVLEDLPQMWPEQIIEE